MFVYTGLLYITLPYGPSFYKDIEASTNGAFRYYLNAIFLVVGTGLLVYIAFGRFSDKIERYLWLLGIAMGYGLFLTMTELPSERIHFLEYGLLSWPLAAALRHDFSGPRLLLFASLIISLLGFMDEGIQWLLPRGFFDLKDVWMNTAGGFLGLLLVRFVILPKDQCNYIHDFSPSHWNPI